MESEGDDIARRLMDYDESARDGATPAAPEPEPVVVPDPAAIPPSRKNISIKASAAEEVTLPISEEELLSAVRPEKPSAGGDYLMLESDLPVAKLSPAPAANNALKAADTDPGSPIRDGSSGTPSDSHSLTAKPTS